MKGRQVYHLQTNTQVDSGLDLLVNMQDETTCACLLFEALL